MPRTLLVSVGTSIAGPAREGTPLNQLQKCPQGWDTDAPGLEEQIRTRLAGLDLRSERGRIQASAELNALHRLGCRDEDDVVLLATDTADGRCCAEALATVIEREFGCRRPRLERIAGLQVHDAERLRREGLVALCRTLIRYLDDPQRLHEGGCIVCPNGGFKGIVPFLTLLAMAFRAPSVYVFEHAETLIRLPPLPMTIDRNLLARASDALGWAQQQGLFDVSAFLARIPGLASEERELFESLLETVPDASGRQLAALSQRAARFWQKISARTASLPGRKKAECLLRLWVSAALLRGPSFREVVCGARGWKRERRGGRAHGEGRVRLGRCSRKSLAVRPGPSIPHPTSRAPQKRKGCTKQPRGSMSVAVQLIGQASRAGARDMRIAKRGIYLIELPLEALRLIDDAS